MGRRTLLLIASILVAAVGTALIFLYVRGADTRANEDAAPMMVAVVVTSVKQGTPAQDAVEAASIQLQPRPRGDLPDGYFTSLGEVKSLGTSAALFDIPLKQVVTRAMFARAGAGTTATGLKSGQFAISVQLGDPERVAGLLKPGSTVAVIVTTPKDASFLMSNITVISIGTNGQAAAVPGALGEPVDNKIISLAVSAEQALNLRLADSKSATLSLLLEGPGPKISSSLTITDLAFS